MAALPAEWPVADGALTPETADAVLDAAPKAALGNVQPGGDAGAPPPKVRFAVATDGERLGLKWWVSETHVLGRCAQDGGTPEVWTDSCVEFFCSHAGMAPGRYFNFEFSCVGVLLTHVGEKGNRGPQPDDVQRSVWRKPSLGEALIPEPRTAPAEWTLTAVIPKSAIGVDAGKRLDGAGVGLVANAYKCGDKLPHPHWVTLFPIATKSPDFHRPDGFQPIVFAAAAAE